VTDNAPFSASAVAVDGHIVIAVTGEIDASTAGRLWSAIEHSLHPDHPLVLDMHKVTFFDASGLRVLLRSQEHCPQLVLRSPSRMIRRVLEATETDQLMTIQTECYEPGGHGATARECHNGRSPARLGQRTTRH